MRKYRWWLVAILIIILAAFGLHLATSSKVSQHTVTVGAIGPDVQVWQHIAKSKAAKEVGIKINVKSFTDPIGLNKATASGEIDVNAFQSWSYLETYNKQNKKAQLAALGTTFRTNGNLFETIQEG